MPNPLYPPANPMYPTTDQQPSWLDRLLSMLSMKKLFGGDDDQSPATGLSSTDHGKGYLLSWGGGPRYVIGGGPAIPTSKPLQYESGTTQP